MKTAIAKYACFLSVGLINIQKIVLVISSILITIGIATQASFRYFFQIDFFGFEEVIVLMAFWLYFIGASYGSYTKSHITADIINVYMKNDKARKIVMLLKSLITLIISFLFAYWSYDYVIWLVERSTTTSVLKIPIFLSRSAILVGFILMTGYFILHIYNDFRDFIAEELRGNNSSSKKIDKGGE